MRPNSFQDFHPTSIDFRERDKGAVANTDCFRVRKDSNRKMAKVIKYGFNFWTQSTGVIFHQGSEKVERSAELGCWKLLTKGQLNDDRREKIACPISPRLQFRGQPWFQAYFGPSGDLLASRAWVSFFDRRTTGQRILTVLQDC